MDVKDDPFIGYVCINKHGTIGHDVSGFSIVEVRVACSCEIDGNNPVGDRGSITVGNVKSTLKVKTRLNLHKNHDNYYKHSRYSRIDHNFRLDSSS